MSSPRVFCVQNQQHLNNSNTLAPKFDVTSASKYGEIIYLLSPTARPFMSAHVVGQLRERLCDYTDDDYLLLIGNPCLIGFTVAIASSFNGGRVKVLQWDGRRREYVEVKADLSPPHPKCRAFLSTPRTHLTCARKSGHAGPHRTPEGNTWTMEQKVQ